MDIFENFKLYANSKIKLYRKIYNSIVEAIDSKSLKTGTKLPSIRNLSTSIQASKNSVTKAYELLEKDGYIYSIPKSGYYAKSPNENVSELIKEENPENEIPTVDSICKEYVPSGDVFDANSLLENSKSNTIILSDAFSNHHIEETTLKASALETKKNNTVILSSGDTYSRENLEKNISSLDAYLKESFNNVLTNQRDRLNQNSDPFGDESIRISFSAFLYKETNIDVNPSDLIIDSGIKNQLRNILDLPYIKKLKEENEKMQRGQGLLKVAEELSSPAKKVKPSILFAKNPGEHIKEIFQNAGFECFESDAIFQDNGLSIMEEHNVTIVFISPLDIIGRPEWQIKNGYKNYHEWLKNKNHLMIEHDSSLIPNENRKLYPTFRAIKSNPQIIFIKSLEFILSKGLNSSCTILPQNLLEEYKEKYRCYGCMLPLINQLTLSNLIISGKLYSYLDNLKTL
ncbi:winged helix-turn-helix domain-containing protein [Treponema sp.]|uniref:winged helix-turn-helix domain-containing protein n=1 Tax=Treponema sp. TaxID=166 RepID=UPI0025EA4A08|nr:winged helix-turn-helix domain-containing protein [Treponema sp.]MCR5217680.1 winged helix-turn-helix domain-containing protein [Treponema sp.]